MGQRQTLSAALGLGILAFWFRVLSSVDLSNDHYMHMAWAQQLLFGEVPGRDFVDPGMPLAYTMSAAAQWLRPGPFAELVLSAAFLGVAASVTFLVAKRLSGSILVAVAVTVLEIALRTRLYSYPKILVPAVAMLLFQKYADARTLPWLAALGVWTGLAGLLRHDLAVYAAAGIAVGLVVLRWPDLRRACSSLAIYTATVAVTLLPYALFVGWSEGIAEHLRRGLEFAKGESHQRAFDLPALTSLDVLGWGRDDAAAFLFYAAYGSGLVAVALMLGRRSRHSPQQRAAAAAATAMLVAYIVVVLRHPLDARLPDLGAVLAIVLAWVLGQAVHIVSESFTAAPLGPASFSPASSGPASSGRAPFLKPGRRRLVTAAAAAAATIGLVVVTSRSVSVLANTAEALDNTGISGGWGDVRETWTDLKERGTAWPWARSWPSRDLPEAVPYLNACTESSDAVLTTWPAPEYYFFARRRFGAGHAEFLPPRAFATEEDQRQMLARLEHQRVPIVLINESRREEFAAAFPRLDAYLRTHYAGAGRFAIYDGSEITVAARRDLRATRSWGADQWPCGFEREGAGGPDVR